VQAATILASKSRKKRGKDTDCLSYILDARTQKTDHSESLPGNESLRTLAIRAKERGKAGGFALLNDGLCMVSIRPSLEKENILITIRPLKGANWLAD